MCMLEFVFLEKCQFVNFFERGTETEKSRWKTKCDGRILRRIIFHCKNEKKKEKKK